MKPTAADLIASGTGYLHRGHLRELGLERRAIDAVFRECPVVFLPGYSRPMIRVEDFLAFMARHAYTGDEVRPT